MLYNALRVYYTFMYLITLAGFPTAIAFFGIFFVTMLPAPIIAPSDILTPGRTTQFEPIQTLSPITICFGVISARFKGLKL